ncbi:MAG: glycosyltransferase family 2 protein [Phycisphaerales bacterium]|nr:glycosyltransferase family 2 protein [Phycisphaerales bacterium]
MQVLIALPVFNEERYVQDVLGRIRLLTDHVLVVDDGSTDATPQILSKIPAITVIRHPENRGYGQSLIDAFDYSDRHNYDWVITIDCDDQHEPAQIPAFLERAARGDVDVVSGSRYLQDFPGNTAAPSDRRRINRQITELLNSTLGLELTDAFCGFKAYRVSAVSRLTLSIPGYAFPLQFWAQAACHRLRISELPVPLVYHDPTRHFGGMLDEPDSRLEHYLDVFRAELARLQPCLGTNHAPCESPCPDA